MPQGDGMKASLHVIEGRGDFRLGVVLCDRACAGVGFDARDVDAFCLTILEKRSCSAAEVEECLWAVQAVFLNDGVLPTKGNGPGKLITAVQERLGTVGV